MLLSTDTAALLLAVVPVLAGAITMLLADRSMNTDHAVLSSTVYSSM